MAAPIAARVGCRMRVRRIRSHRDMHRHRHRSPVSLGHDAVRGELAASPAYPAAFPALRPCRAPRGFLRRSPDSSRARSLPPRRSGRRAAPLRHLRWSGRRSRSRNRESSRAVHHESRDPAAPHQVQQNVAQPALDHVPAHAPQDRPLRVARAVCSASTTPRKRIARQDRGQRIQPAGDARRPSDTALAKSSTRTLPPRASIGTVFKPVEGERLFRVPAHAAFPFAAPCAAPARCSSSDCAESPPACRRPPACLRDRRLRGPDR